MKVLLESHTFFEDAYYTLEMLNSALFHMQWDSSKKVWS